MDDGVMARHRKMKEMSSIIEHTGKVLKKLSGWQRAASTVLRQTCLLLGLSWLMAFTGWAQSGPQPGDVYREYVRVISSGGNDWRVTDPDVIRPDAQSFLPNSVLDLEIGDLQGAIRAEVTIDRWGGHPGTYAKQIRFNDAAWIELPEVYNTGSSKPECYMYQDNVTIDVPLGDLQEGTNTFEGTAGDDEGYSQSCFNFNWPQWGWYGVIVRIYYDPALKAHPTGAVVSPAENATVSDNPTVAASAAGDGAEIDRVDFVAYYDGYDQDGDGIYQQWQYRYHRQRSENALPLRGHVGTAVAPQGGEYQVQWDTEWVPDQQPGSIKLAARIQDSQGLWYMTEAVDGLTLERSSHSIKLYKAEGVPSRFWVRNGDTLWSQFTIPAGDNVSLAEEALLYVATWNGVDGEGWSVNGSAYAQGIGANHHYSFDMVPVLPDQLVSGTNEVSFHSTSSGHGIEILWPGPAVAVRYPPAGANALPVAQASATPASGSAPLTVTFDGTGSSDPDGTITSYA
ncbi:MAG: hypothetical protein GVY18_08620, partial [Bacteroidetes bacterium]|nr:hypothetical protein [Bacteroidota bacterium]